VWEKLGKEKRDLLRDNIEAVRTDQRELADEFKSALDRLQEAYGTGGGDVESMYTNLKRDYDRSESRASGLRRRMVKVETIAADLFSEWKSENDTIHNSAFRNQSARELEDTKERFKRMRDAMHRAEKSIDPVLTDLRDHMLVLKHALNSQAVSNLGRTEVADIERGIQDLIRDMNESVRRADDFLGALGET
jgi:predicted  nucleic acid-binding Zn-ribbon protein